VIGRAGSGKTRYCLDSIRKHLRRSPGDGETLLLLVPEQATLQMERALFCEPDLVGAARCFVLGFRRLQYLILAEVGIAGKETVSPLARQMAVQFLLNRHADDLEVFGRIAQRPRTAARVASTIADFFQQGILPDHLLQVARRMAAEGSQQAEEDPSSGASAVPPILRAKMRDLATLYRAYTRWLAGERVDSAQLLTLAAEHIRDCRWLRGARVWVDGFAGFTVQQRYALQRLAQSAEQVEIALLLEPNLLTSDAPPEPYDLFYRTWQTYQRLLKTFRDAGIEVTEPLVLSDEPPRRFVRAPTLARIESRIFRTTGQQMAPAVASDQVDIIEAPNRRVEVEAVARKIVDLTRTAPADEALRYRQIGVILRDLGPYHDLISEIFTEHGIPFFIDWRRSVSHHPLAELVRALLRLVSDEGWSIDAVGSLLKTGLTPIPPERADMLENYLLAHGVNGWHLWKSPDDWAFLRNAIDRDEDFASPGRQDRILLEKVNRTRKLLARLLADWAELAGKRLPAERWADALYSVIENLKIPEKLARWQSTAALRSDDLQQQQIHLRVWNQFTQLLDDLVAGFGSEPLSAEEFRSIVEAGLEGFSLPLVPPAVDQVIVGSVERSRQPELAAAFVLGFNEGLFPPKPAEDPILTDAEREAIQSLAPELELSPTSRQRLFDERLLAYIAMTRPSRYLWISYCSADESGRQIAPSPYIRALRAAVPHLSVTKLQDPSVELKIGNVGTRWQAANCLVRAALAADRNAGCANAVGDLPAFGALWAWARDRLPLAQAVRRCASALDYANEARISAEQAAAMFGQPLTCSVSQLEEFAQCPYRHFASYGLRLAERAEFELAAVELGSIYHRILYKIVSRLREKRWSLAEIEPETLSELVRHCTTETLTQIADEFADMDARGRFLLNRAYREIGRAMLSHRNLWRRSKLEPIALEAKFGFEDGELPAMELRTEKGRTVIIRGKIDRIDMARIGARAALAVIDYKRSVARNYNLNVDLVVAGIQLQVLVYLLAAMEAARKGCLPEKADHVLPAGALLFPLLPEIEKVTPAEFASNTMPRDKQMRLRGLVNESCLEVFHDDLAEDVRSRSIKYDDAPISIAINKDGSIHGRCRGWVKTPTALDDLMSRTYATITRLADRILDGTIEIRPYRYGKKTACNNCPYDAVCRFDPLLNTYNEPEKVTLAGEEKEASSKKSRRKGSARRTSRGSR